jgi:nucleoid-associated protein YgaU
MTAALRIARTLAVGVLLACPITANAQRYDLQSGDYLTAEEYKKLSKDEALAYCQKLSQEIDIQNDNAAAANGQMGDIDAEIAALQARLAEARGVTGPLASEVAELERRLRELGDLPRSYTVIEGDWLIKISGKSRIYNDKKQWRKIFQANRDKIRDENLIYPGQIFLISR